MQFVSRVNLPFVNQTDGMVDASKLPVLAHWNRNSSLETVLVEIRRYVFLSVFSLPFFLFLHSFALDVETCEPALESISTRDRDG